MIQTPSLSAAVLVIGNEVLSGRTQDVNLVMMARKLFVRGINLAEARVVPDLRDAIIEAVNALRMRHGFLFTTGGIGPTHDDITVASVAAAFGVDTVEHPEARARLAAYYGGEDNLNPARLRMALVPEGAGLIDNPLSGAPGVRMENVFMLAGVPSIAAAMFDAALATLPVGVPQQMVSVACHVLESLLADDLAKIAIDFPFVDIGSYPSLKEGRPSLSLVVRGTDSARIEEAVIAIEDLIRSLGDTPERR